jgi:hypothetical protein
MKALCFRLKRALDLCPLEETAGEKEGFLSLDEGNDTPFKEKSSLYGKTKPLKHPDHLEAHVEHYGDEYVLKLLGGQKMRRLRTYDSLV